MLTCALVLVQAGWQPLWNGEDLTQFVKLGGDAVYYISDGAIVGETRPNTPNTFLCTKKRYSDFELTFEVLVDDELNSGVQIRSNSVPGYRDGTVHGYQVEIDPSPRSYSGGIYDESRRGWLQDLALNRDGREAFKNGEWNSYRILCEGDTITTWINGVECASVDDDLTREGFIGLQVHGVGEREDPLKVSWRNLRIRDLGHNWRKMPVEADPLLIQERDMRNWTKKNDPGAAVGWEWANGAMQVAPSAGDAMTRGVHGSCLLYLEFMVDDNGQTGQANGNSGVYLQGRYEVQVLNSAPRGPLVNECGAIYGVKAPDFAMARNAGEWQSYLIDFTPAQWSESGEKTANARMTVYHNGTKVHDNVEVPSSTGAGQPEINAESPLVLQDHGHPIRYRNIWMLRR